MNGYLRNMLGISFPAQSFDTVTRQTASDTVPQPTQYEIPVWTQQLLHSARSQVGVTRYYDGSYAAIGYPGGDIDRKTGVCTDVVIRALRDAHNIDLQVAIHEDMKRAFSSYPKNWGLSRTDRNIDHRRVPNIQTYLARQGYSLPLSDTAQTYRPGDIVTWTVSGSLPHIGILSDKMDPTGQHPLVIHNIGAGTQEDNILFSFPITGHYRLNPGT
ncbi:DUF1287 domain-containing protein [Aliiroseovarius crassostreae]|uniref:DUF1287 domain-containing protein n=1 Tax=Aliiroseovarius crassostreae TaxID=154981 RepID=UPI0022063ABD|nr:DUF1287 domain-containing protein [Aliiroseovarius crassostreae]UWQ06799.1 DUF1287 domain-containing protein [Aliiroseovarius crassostreae]UWQ09901.1 DUF1287 domain-containing protein [Aliiroseovarius crassostreae]